MNKQIIEPTDYENGIDLIEILSDIWKHKFMVIALTILCMSVSAVNIMYFTPYTYTADGVLYVSNKANAHKNTESVDKSDIDTARTMSETYIETLKTREFLMNVSDMTSGKYSWGQIKRMINISSINETELLAVKVTSSSPDDAYQIAKAITQLAPEKLSDVCDGGSVRVIDKVMIPLSPNSKGTVKSVCVGGIVGFVLSILIVVVLGLFDTKVHKSEDVAKRYDIYILGELSQ